MESPEPVDRGETIDDVDEVKLLGYFETMKGTFITKWVFLLHFLDANGNLVGDRLKDEVLDDVRQLFPDPNTCAALRQGNKEMLANYKEDIVTSAVLGAWNVFEQLTKDLLNQNYAHNPDDLRVNYQQNDFGLSEGEKRNLDVINYVRNAILHYNGAYYAYRDIDQHYRGHHFRSAGHQGEKIVVSPELTWHILCDIEAYAIKAWQNYKAFHA